MSKSLTKEAISHERTCCGVIEEATYQAREKKANRTKAQPWIVLKLMVGFTLGLMGYTAYVYIGRLCVSMIRGHEGTGGSKGTGIALLVVFVILFLWMMWAYLKVILTPPGYARECVPRSSRPLFSEPRRPTSHQTYDYDPERGHQRQPSPSVDQSHGLNDIGGPSYENIPMRSNRERNGDEEPVPTAEVQELNTGVLDALPRPHPIPTSDLTPKPESRLKKQRQPSVSISRRIPKTPVLLPEHRYCSIDELVKPYRTHHCRNCGTCVLKYDHHCPWIGQCVGARNQKFFLNFVQAASIFTLYTFSTLVAFTVRAVNSSDGDIDPQHIVIIALSALFALFTVPLQISHVILILKGQTTVESMQARTLKDKENQVLADQFGYCGITDKTLTRRAWDEEWGTIEKEGNIWWLGSKKKGWEDVMGKNPWGWFLPIGRSLNNGLSYPINPRFDQDGLWRRRIEWPKELR